MINNLSYRYGKLKQQVNENEYYKPNSLNESASSERKLNLVSKQDNRVELVSWHLPPRYMESYDKCNDILKELSIKLGKLQEEQQKRMTPKFDESENKILDNNINLIIGDMTDKIKLCERGIREIKMEQVYTPQDEQIKDNMRQNLLKKLGEFTKSMKVNQESYVDKYKEINSAEEAEQNKVEDKANMFKQESKPSNEQLVERNKEINKLLTSITELSQIFKEVQALVLDQGTVLDRIDYNIENAKVQTKLAHKELVKAEESSSSSCVRNANLFLILGIVIMGLMLIFKIFK